MEFVSKEYISIQPILNKQGCLKGASKVLINGHLTQCLIKGVTLKFCIKIYSYYLLFVSREYSLEESSGIIIYLLNDKIEVIDQSIILAKSCEGELWGCDGDEYFGYIINLKIIFPNIITFQFANNFWKLEILKDPFIFNTFSTLETITSTDCQHLVIRPRKQYSSFDRILAFLFKYPLLSIPKNLNRTYLKFSLIAS